MKLWDPSLPNHVISGIGVDLEVNNYLGRTLICTAPNEMPRPRPIPLIGKNFARQTVVLNPASGSCYAMNEGPWGSMQGRGEVNNEQILNKNTHIWCG